MKFRLLLLLPIVSAWPAEAHDLWINRGGYRNAFTHEWCCGDNDCFAIPPDHVRVTPQGYVLPSGEIVPAKEGLISEDQNYWRCRRPDGSRRCFFVPGTGM